MYPQVRNPYAASLLAGLNDVSPEGYLDKPFKYLYDKALTASQALTNEAVPIMTDSDFVMRGLIVSRATSMSFSVRLFDSTGYFLSNAQIFANNLSTFAGQPFPVVPEWFFPAGGKIGIDITDISAAPNTIQLTFVGVKRFRVKR